MEKHECLEQLKGLLENSKDMSQEDGDVWAKDVEALKMAIKSVAGVDMAAWNARIFREGIKCSEQSCVNIMTACTVSILNCMHNLTNDFGSFSGVCLVAALRKMESLVLAALETQGDTKEEIIGAADDICKLIQGGFMVGHQEAKL